MTYELSISAEKQLVHATLEGPYSIDFLKNMIEKVVTGNDYQKSYNFLVDFRKVLFDPTGDDLEALSDFISTESEFFPNKLARVLNDDHLKPFFEQLASREVGKGCSSRIFNSVDEAMDWFYS